MGKLTSKEYLSSGSFVVPAGITQVIVRGWGGGGNGSSGASLIYGQGRGGGGGGGALAYTHIVSVVPGSTISVVIGAGGTIRPTPDPYGNDGGNSSFGSYIFPGASGGSTSYDGGGTKYSFGGVTVNTNPLRATNLTAGTTSPFIPEQAQGGFGLGPTLNYVFGYGGNNGSYSGGVPGLNASNSEGSGGAGGGGGAGPGGPGGNGGNGGETTFLGTAGTSAAANSGAGGGGGGAGGANSDAGSGEEQAGSNGGAGGSGYILVSWVE